MFYVLFYVILDLRDKYVLFISLMFLRSDFVMFDFNRYVNFLDLGN